MNNVSKNRPPFCIKDPKESQDRFYAAVGLLALSDNTCRTLELIRDSINKYPIDNLDNNLVLIYFLVFFRYI